MIENEIVLLEKSKNGDIDAFEELIEGYQKKVFNIAFRMIGNYDDASELAQEVFIKIFKGIKNFMCNQNIILNKTIRRKSPLARVY